MVHAIKIIYVTIVSFCILGIGIGYAKDHNEALKEKITVYISALAKDQAQIAFVQNEIANKQYMIKDKKRALTYHESKNTLDDFMEVIAAFQAYRATVEKFLRELREKL
jgi:hypothetical protein